MHVINTNLKTVRERFSRISWGGVFAGALTAIVISFLLHLLGLGLGLNTIDPMTDNQPFDGLGTGTLIWWILSNLSALFVGGLIAARSAGLPSNADGGIHGFLAWGLYLLISVYLVVSFAGTIFSGVGSLVSSAFGGSDAKEVVVNLKNAQKMSQKDSDFTFGSIKDEMFQIIESAERYNVLPSDSKEEVKEAMNTTQSETSKLVKQLDLKDKVSEFINDVSVDLDDDGDLKIMVEGNKDYLNKEEIKDYLANNTELSESEIEGVITKWDRKIEKTVKKIENTYAEAKQDAVQASEKISDGLGKASVYLFIILLLGALAAFGGGAIGAPLLTVNEEHDQNLINDNETNY